MVPLVELVRYLDELLQPEAFQDYCPNGLQVEGCHEVSRLVAGVTATQALIDTAIERGADVILVHHGFFWKGEDARITGMKLKRLKKLLANDISVIAYHLPLDAHAEYGNNVQLARELDFSVDGSFGGRMELALYGRLPGAMSGEALSQHITDRLGRAPLHIAGEDAPITTVGWCTGAAQSFIEDAVSEGLDAFISGEISEQTVHVARETGIHFFATGHHATERYGVRALAEHLSQHFDINTKFVDIDNPV